MSLEELIEGIDPKKPVLIAGPTASGKSGLALAIAERQGGIIVNADALQIFENWRVLTARPSHQETARVPHALYGHVKKTAHYSVGHWLREVTPLLNGKLRPIIVGGTGLNFSALTEGLAEIPQTPDEVRAEANARMDAQGYESLLKDLDPKTRGRIDVANPARVQRAWEVFQATRRPLADWQDTTPPPRLPLNRAQALLLDAPKEWLSPRIERRFDLMLKTGAMDEVSENMAEWDPKLPSSKAIGAPELIAYLRGKSTLREATDLSVVATRQYAKRQRTWFRARMREWRKISHTTL